MISPRDDARDRFGDMIERARMRMSDLVGDAVLFVDDDGRIVYANDGAVRLYGYTSEELLALDIRDLRAEQTDRIYERFAERAMPEGVLLETVQRRKDGTVVPVEVSVTTIVGDEGRLMIGWVRDISERKAAERELRLKSLLLDSTTDSVFVHYLDGHMIYVNEAAARIRGFTREEMLAMRAFEWVAPEVRDKVAYNLDRLLRQGSLVFESVNVRKDGTMIPLEVHSSVIDLDGRPAVVSIGRDIAERIRAEETIRHMAYHDNLTGLPNRKLLHDRMLVALANARRHEDLLAVIFFDLDDFKEINDAFGHAVGDGVLEAVAVRMRGCTREGDTLARLGGDEFVLLLPRVPSVRDVVAVAEKILQLLQPAFVVDDREFRVSASVGVTVSEGGAGTPESLLHEADVAMYRSKSTGGDRYTVWEPVED